MDDYVCEEPRKVSDLPVEVLRWICKYLTGFEIFRLAQINRRMYNQLVGEWFYDHSAPSHNAALLLAAEYNALEAVKQIIRNGADVNAKHPLNGYNALISASEEGHTDIVLYLLNCSGIDVNAATGYGRTALYCAALYGYEDIVQGLLGCSILKANVKDFYDATPLILAAKNGHHAILLLLLERGDAELNATCFNIETDGKPTMPEINFDGHTALFWAALGGHTKTVSALLEASHAPIAERSLNILRSEWAEKDDNDIERMIDDHQIHCGACLASVFEL